MCPPSTPLTTEGEEDEDEEEDGEEEEDVVVMEEGESGPWWERGGVPVIWGGGGGFLHTILQVPESCEEMVGKGKVWVFTFSCTLPLHTLSHNNTSVRRLLHSMILNLQSNFQFSDIGIHFNDLKYFQ